MFWGTRLPLQVRRAGPDHLDARLPEEVKVDGVVDDPGCWPTQAHLLESRGRVGTEEGRP